MKLPSTLTRNKIGFTRSHFLKKSGAGFTLIEILVVMSVITLLAAVTMIAGIDTYQRYLFRADLSTAGALLQKARGSSVSNIGETSHGVYFGTPGAFVLFRGNSWVLRNAAYDLSVPTGKSLMVTPSNPTQDVVFTQLSGETSAGNVTLSDGARTAVITLNNEGAINW